MPDFLAYELVAALARRGCPVCRALSLDETRWLDTFCREAKNDPGVIRTFLAAGGLCAGHTRALCERAEAAGAVRGLERIFRSLAEQDVGRLADAQVRGRRGRRGLLERRTACPACTHRAGAASRKVALFVEALREAPVRARYARSDGLCYAHLAAAVEAAAAEELELVPLLLEDWRARLRRACADAEPALALARLYAGLAPCAPTQPPPATTIAPR